MNRLMLAATLLFAAGAALGQSPAPPCKECAAWNAPQPPFRVYGNAYYVGTHGLTSLLITSDQGHILIDGALAESAPQIAESIRTLGFRIEDVKLILNTHIHYDHAGGIAELQRLSGAKVAASAPSAKVLKSGQSGKDDPQFGILPPIGKIKTVHVIKDGETLHVGPLAITAHLTPGHTPGGTSWSWQSCEAERCLHIVYADSLSAISAPGFKFSHAPPSSHALENFERSFTTLEKLRCDVLVSPHPQTSNLWARLEKREHGDKDAFVDPQACEMYVDSFRQGLRKRLAEESAQ